MVLGPLVTLAFRHDERDPDEVTTALGAASSSVHRPGDRPRAFPEMAVSDNAWFWKFDDAKKVPAAIDAMLAGPLARETGVGQLRALGWRVEISVTLHPWSHYADILLLPEQMTALGRMGIPVDLFIP